MTGALARGTRTCLLVSLQVGRFSGYSFLSTKRVTILYAVQNSEYRCSKFRGTLFKIPRIDVQNSENGVQNSDTEFFKVKYAEFYLKKEVVNMKKSSAPMPKEEKDICNPMKLYTYLICISGLATYPENTRMFRHKNLALTKIKETIGITDKTTKLYLYQLEQQQLVLYRGQIKYLTEEERGDILNKIKNITSQAVKERKYNELAGAVIWKKRNKEEKNGVYYIPRPNRWMPIPEVTLEKLNETFGCSELELKIYLLCCSYKDMCDYSGAPMKIITFENIRDALKIKKKDGNINKEIRRALLFLKGIGLIDYQEQSLSNLKGARIPCFKLKQVNYYINYTIQKLEEKQNDIDWQMIIERIDNIFLKEGD